MGNKIVSIDQFRSKKEEEKNEIPCYGCMVWLHCPTCNKMEYTEVQSPYGRTHKCGTQVFERNVELDLRAEVTITQENIKILQSLIQEQEKSKLKQLFIKSFGGLIQKMLDHENDYLQRILIAGKNKVQAYSGIFKDIMHKLPIEETNPLGVHISTFRFQPEKRFQEINQKK